MSTSVEISFHGGKGDGLIKRYSLPLPKELRFKNSWYKLKAGTYEYFYSEEVESK